MAVLEWPSLSEWTLDGIGLSTYTKERMGGTEVRRVEMGAHTCQTPEDLRKGSEKNDEGQSERRQMESRRRRIEAR